MNISRNSEPYTESFLEAEQTPQRKHSEEMPSISFEEIKHELYSFCHIELDTDEQDDFDFWWQNTALNIFKDSVFPNNQEPEFFNSLRANILGLFQRERVAEDHQYIETQKQFFPLFAFSLSQVSLDEYADYSQWWNRKLTPILDELFLGTDFDKSYIQTLHNTIYTAYKKNMIDIDIHAQLSINVGREMIRQSDKIFAEQTQNIFQETAQASSEVQKLVDTILTSHDEKETPEDFQKEYPTEQTVYR